MQIIRDKKYLKKIQNILEYIAKDSLNQALKFQVKLDESIDKLVDMPYKFRKSIYFENENIRDLIFKEYVIPYKIDKNKNQIIIIGINKYQKKL
ncbi:MAG: plasmid stabilization protein [Sulfurimonas sp.]|nr:MAG: plasmid stabilization protein [Sulfurimonas sp.]